MVRKAFTLVELLIVVVIIAVLAAIAIPKFSDSITRSREASLRAELKLVRQAIEVFKSDTGVYPLTLSDLTLPATSPPDHGKNTSGALTAFSSALYKGPYLSTVYNNPVDGSALNYNSVTPPTVGRVYPNSGTATDGTNYSTW